MKKIFLAFMVALLIGADAAAQSARLHLTINNTTATGCHIWIPDMALGFDYLKKGTFNIQLDSNKSGYRQFAISEPHFVNLTCYTSDANDAKYYNYLLYLSPGDDISLKMDFNAKDYGVTVTGKGSRNNQPMIATFPDLDYQKLYAAKDTLPYRIIKAVNQHYRDYKSNLEKYIATYQPSADFIKNEQIYLAYLPACAYYDIKENNKFEVYAAYQRNQYKWEKIQDSLFAAIKLDNPAALSANSYTQLLRDFLLRTKEGLWTEAYNHPAAFYKEWYDADTAAGKKAFQDDMQNLLQEKIINKYFTGAPAAYLYAVLLDDALGENNPQNLPVIYDRFKQQFPNSKYVAWFGPAIDTLRKKETQPLTADMIIVPGNGSNLDTFDDLIKLTKGKTVLLDMWGTWCGPCRNEIHDNGPAIKAYFKGKGLDYFYVANRDLEHEEEWKKLIAYFNMTGTHILANANLTRDIMAKVKGQGFPTYVIIRRDGSYELSKAGYPMDRAVLVKQLEDALAQ